MQRPRMRLTVFRLLLLVAVSTPPESADVGCLRIAVRIKWRRRARSWQPAAFLDGRIKPDWWTGSQIGRAPTPNLESEMARHQVQNHIAEPCRAGLAILLIGILPSCHSESTARKSVDVNAQHVSVPIASRAPTDATAVPTTIEEVAVPDPSPSEPVTAVMTIQPKCASVGETVEVLVHIRIASAHFIHAKDDSGGPFVPVTVKTTLPEGVEPIGDWQIPTPEKGRANALIYRDSVLLRRSLRVVSRAEPENLTVVGELQYQVCTDELCWPKGKMKLSAPLVIQSQPR